MTTVKPPKFDGTGDVGYFQTQFTSAATLGKWDDALKLHHLRQSLTGTAETCGTAEDVAGVMSALEARFGITQTQAMTDLMGLKREAQTSLTVHADRVKRLVGAAYKGAAEDTLRKAEITAFRKSINHTSLERLLQAMRIENLTEAVREGQEYLGSSGAGRETIRQVGEMPEEGGATGGVAAISGQRQDELTELRKQVEQLTLLVQQQSTGQGNQGRSGRGNRRNRPSGCWNCGEAGHFARNCPAPPKGNGPRE